MGLFKFCELAFQTRKRRQIVTRSFVNTQCDVPRRANTSIIEKLVQTATHARHDRVKLTWVWNSLCLANNPRLARCCRSAHRDHLTIWQIFVSELRELSIEGDNGMFGITAPAPAGIPPTETPLLVRLDNPTGRSSENWLSECFALLECLNRGCLLNRY